MDEADEMDGALRIWVPVELISGTLFEADRCLIQRCSRTNDWPPGSWRIASPTESMT
jgi:hypothetical protein